MNIIGFKRNVTGFKRNNKLEIIFKLIDLIIQLFIIEYVNIIIKNEKEILNKEIILFSLFYNR